MIKFILGRSGSGKTEMIHKYIGETGNDKRVVLIVPEQSSFQNEKRILDTMGAKRARNVEVLSFRRLCDNIFDKYKGITEKRIDDGIKAVLMNIAIENAPAEGGELELYGSTSRSLKKSMDLIEPMLTAVNEYKMCLITPEKLFETAGRTENRILAAKLRDSARIYAAYNALLENSYADPDDDLIKLYAILGEHNYFENMSVFIDSFYGFSAQEIKIIERIFSQAEDVFISVCCDRDNIHDKNSIFAESNETYRTLLRSVERSGRKCGIEVCSGEGIRYKTDVLRAVEKRIFSAYRHTAENTDKIKNDGSVRMYEAADIYDEVRYIAEKIFTLVHDEGYRYSDIEVIGRNLDSFKGIISAEFPKYDIPYFLSNPEPLEIKPLIRMILSVFEVIHSNFDTEAVLRLAKTGLTPLEDYDIYLLENYCYVWDIRGKRWREEFTMSPDGSRADNIESKSVNDRIAHIEDIRKKIIQPLIEFEEGVKRAEDGAEITVRLYELLEKLECRENFRKFIYKLSRNGLDVNVGHEAGIWDIAMRILGNMYDVLKNKRTDSIKYAELLAIYIRKNPVSDIPQTINSVTIGTAGNIRSESPKVVFAIGAVESVFPAQAGAVGIFTDSERRFLRDEQPDDIRLPLYDSIYGASLKEKMNVYVTLSAPSERLYISWYMQDLSGKACEPSVIKREMESVIDDCTVYHKSEITENAPSDKRLFLTERQSFDICAELWNTDGIRANTLKKYFRSVPEYCDKVFAIERAAKREAFRLNNHAGIRKLYGIPVNLSSTKIDTFADCRFSYFCKYGLEAKPLKKASMDNALYGTSMHFIFEYLFKNTGIDRLMEMDEGQLRLQIKSALDEYIGKLGDEAERSERFNAICVKIKKNALRVLMRMCEQFKKDKFRPVDYELRIGEGNDGENSIPPYELELPNGDRILVSGFVDRVDTAAINGKKYVRIIDYKTGNNKFEFKNIANKIKIQMLLYLSAIIKNGSEKYADGEMLLPAGVLYVPSTSVSGPADISNTKETERSIREQNNNFRMSGLLTDDCTVLENMEEGIGGEFIPAQKTKTPPYKLSANSSVVSEKDFRMILEFTDICIKRAAAEIYSGEIAAMPTQGACKYCEYSSICRFEKGNATVRLPKYSKKQSLEKIRRDMEEMGEETDE